MRKRPLVSACAILFLAASASTLAKEGGDQYPNGIENWYTGALPPPGWYLINYTGYWNGYLRDGNGDRALLPVVDASGAPTGEFGNAELTAFYTSFRFVRSTNIRIGSASYAWQVVVPLVDLSMDIPSLGGEAGRTGLGDITINPLILGWHHSEHLHTVFAVDVNVPVGAYTSGDPRRQIGTNYYSIEPIYAVTYMKPDSWQLDAKFMYNYKATRNSDTDYRSGDEFHVDFLVGYNFGPWGVGLNGFYLKQLEDDEQGGVKIGNRGKAFGIGPSVKYSFNPGLHLIATYQKEIDVENRFGGDRFLLKLITGL